ncbi:DNA-3-methyladenine glycosylase [bacterium]|nr:DNA-3-methyladenine glycosylase [bacterium]
MKKILPRSFFGRKTLAVSRELIGMYLCRGDNAFMITETEAYDGFNDEASHARRGETERNRVMFGPAGFWYVYFVYGMHHMLNIVTREREYPAAVLIRSVEGFGGPAKLTKAINIGRELNGRPAARGSNLWIEDRGIVVPNSHISRTSRIGINYAGEKWRSKKWRFVLREGF